MRILIGNLNVIKKEILFAYIQTRGTSLLVWCLKNDVVPNNNRGTLCG